MELPGFAGCWDVPGFGALAMVILLCKSILRRILKSLRGS
jgi:hypothetical protein